MSRIERILHKLCQEHAPQLTPPGWDSEGDPVTRIHKLARKLASYNVVLLVGEVPAELGTLGQMHVEDWVRSYGQFYSLLAKQLFPSFAEVNASYADNRQPPVIVLKGASVPIMVILAGYVIPYMAVKRTRGKITDLELRGFMDVILDELEAGDLSRADYDQIREEGVKILRQMSESMVRHISLTLFDRPILDEIQPSLPNMDEAPPPPAQPPEAKPQERQPPPPPPGTLPEQERITYKLEHLAEDDATPTPTEQMFISDIPLGKRGGTTGRRPPVPDLPDDER